MIGIYIEGDVPGYASDLGHLSRVEDTNKNVELICLQAFWKCIPLPVGDATKSSPYIESHHQFARAAAVRLPSRHVAVLKRPRCGLKERVENESVNGEYCMQGSLCIFTQGRVHA